MAGHKKNASASRILFDRLYKGRPERIVELHKTRKELALGRKIRALREARGLSQSALAKALATKAPAISRIEDADYDGHSLRILRKIAEFFDHELVVTFESRHPASKQTRRMEREMAHA
ncbi:MAG TPA: helix-turn-helix domain-containing protein [Phycisphaerae bacterium]|nr:helix-turn-helix domain-containing protein [Phycisphaerae bacterium]